MSNEQQDTKNHQDYSNLGGGHRLTVDVQERIHAILSRDSKIIWVSKPYQNFIEVNLASIAEELQTAKVIPSESDFKPKILFPIFEDAKQKFMKKVYDNPLELIDQALEKTIKHDKMHRRLVFLGMISAYAPSPLNVILKHETTTGKSWIMIETSKFFPLEDVIIYCDASPTAFYWKYGQILCKEHGNDCPSNCKSEKFKLINLQRKILIFLDQPNDLLLQHMKPLLSHDMKTLVRLATDPNKKGSHKAMEVRLKGWPPIFYASVQQRTDPEISSRAFIISPDDSKEKIDAVLDFQALKQKDPIRWKTEYEDDLTITIGKQLTRETIEFVKKYKQIEIEKPYIEELKQKFKERFPTSPHSMRAFPQLLALTDTVTIINFRRRHQCECEEGIMKLTSTEEDANKALEILEYFLEGLKHGLSTATIDVYKQVIRPLIKEKESVRMKDIVYRFREVKGRLLGQRYIRRYYVEPLLDHGLLNEDKDPDDKRYVLYTLNDAREGIMDQRGQGTSQDNHDKPKGQPPPLGSIISKQPTIETLQQQLDKKEIGDG